MKLTIYFPDLVAKHLRHLPNPAEFVRRAVEEEKGPSEPSDAGAPRWSQIVQRVENESINLGDYYLQFQKDLHEALRD